MWFIGYDYSHYANCEQHNIGYSYDKVYDSSCQLEVIEEAKIMMKSAISERHPDEYQEYATEVLEKIPQFMTIQNYH